MSIKVLAFTKRIDFKTLLETTCKELTGLTLMVKEQLEEFDSMLELLPAQGVLILDDLLDKKEHALLLQKLENLTDKEVFLVTKEKSLHPHIKCFTPDKIQSLIDQLRLKAGPAEEVKTGEYISIPVKSFIHFKVIPFDLFIKLPGGKFIKRIPANEEIDETTIDSLLAKGVQDLYFESAYNTDFSRLLVNNMIGKVKKEYSSREEKIKATNEVFLTTKEIVQSVGLPKKVIQICETVMGSIATDVNKNKNKLSDYLQDVQTTETDENFQFRFIELTSFIATQILLDMNESPEQVRTVVFSAFFCDIALKESYQLDYRTEASIKDIWPDEKKEIAEHALRASEIIAKYKDAPPQASLIIKQHHGSADGKGFPPVIPTNLSSLAKCLIASQELAYAILKNPEVAPAQILKGVLIVFEGSALLPYFKNFQRALEITPPKN